MTDIASLRKKFWALNTATERLVRAEGEASAAVAAGMRCAAQLAQRKIKAEELYNARRAALWDAIFQHAKENT